MPDGMRMDKYEQCGPKDGFQCRIEMTTGRFKRKVKAKFHKDLKYWRERSKVLADIDVLEDELCD